MTAREHGTYAKYRLEACRCYPCAAACSAYNENRVRAIAYGTWHPYVDAAPIRTHLQHLQACGLGLRTIEALTGVGRSGLTAILNGKPGRPPATKVRPHTAQKILAVQATLDTYAGATVIDSTGTVRRLRALIVQGWSQAKLAAHLGLTPPNFTTLMNGSHVIARTARAVRDLYDQLWDQAPPEASHRDKIAASRARNAARARGWVSPLAWDDATIDDPQAVPDLGETGSRQDAIAEDAEELLRLDHSLDQAAERLGISRDYLKQARQRARRKAREVA